MTTYDELTAWAGAENVKKADPDIVAGWQIPEVQKALLIDVGIPIVDQLIEYVSLQSEAEPALQTTSRGPLYRLPQNHHGGLVPDLEWSFGVEPGTGTVYYVLPRDEAWFANSSISLWLQSLHHYGLRVTESDILSDPDDREDEALAELSLLADELRKIDPPAFDGYIGFIWAEFLDRWLW
ncbi:MAG: SUKH-4 family immunity protein [Streptomyces sp.]